VALVGATTLVATLVLLYGGRLVGLPVVTPEKWGGLLLTVVLAVVGQTVAFPLGVLLALARTARDLPAIRFGAIAFVEAVRSLPLVLVLLLSTLIMPVFLPATLPLNTMVMAQIGFIVFSAAALAEVVRGGLQGVPPAQHEGAAALGLGYWRAMRLVVLPQALRMMQPALVGTIVSFVKGSALVVAIGLYDLLGTAMLAAASDKWVGHSVEPLVTVGTVFWAICFTLSRISARWERERAARMTSA
jgi:general L-amino acid transport system permease protein